MMADLMFRKQKNEQALNLHKNVVEKPSHLWVCGSAIITF